MRRLQRIYPLHAHLCVGVGFDHTVIPFEKGRLLVVYNTANCSNWIEPSASAWEQDVTPLLYTDYYKTPTPGRILLFWLRWPVVYNVDMYLHSHPRILGSNFPKNSRFQCARNSKMASHPPQLSFCILCHRVSSGLDIEDDRTLISLVFILYKAHPLMGIPSHLIYTQIFNTLRHVTDGLLVASKVPDGNQLSILHLVNILYPLLNIPDRTDELAHEVRKSALFLEATNVSLIIVGRSQDFCFEHLNLMSKIASVLCLFLTNKLVS
ncbi:uncharacterized protein MELLADRAFT_67618 [Melampsora larici-populina 98AG31]|uniref:Uncharacterized protein n=1 Tax=Melampsora larici-populina (strain 98AG31 / pathotype 3-4-7) TaxID=747676 RepID=F4S3T8_MELLP|nr:uncharacterized protein MELLADRAFT_67618 [Melampsora larici-populina 98AG31]EGG00740.1 hypothetical protein MELLADRAFT_67618 [Melampsora larici-populina 98AG31]